MLSAWRVGLDIIAADRKANIKALKTVNYHCDKNDLTKNAVESSSEVKFYRLYH